MNDKLKQLGDSDSLAFYPLAKEWSVLQHQCDGYEKYALLIKLVAIVLLGAAILTGPPYQPAIALLIGVLWLQDGIWKTFQHRLETRLLQIEVCLAAGKGSDGEEPVAYQLHTNFIAQRQRGGVLREYLTQSMRPTVAFPYAPLLVIYLINMVYFS